jgi:hypothetical protein
MKLTIFNCSPRKGINNTGVLLKRFEEGFKENSNNKCEVYKLNFLKNKEEAVELFQKSEYMLLAFPLYVYSMPTGVKEFIELLEPFRGKCSDKKIGFLVQYGFPEDIHARPLEKYLEKLSESLDCKYLGTIIKGGCDKLITTSETSNREILDGIYEIGSVFGETGNFNKKLLDEYAECKIKDFSKEDASYFIEFVNENYWGAQLKKNGAYDKRYLRSYVK